MDTRVEASSLGPNKSEAYSEIVNFLSITEYSHSRMPLAEIRLESASHYQYAISATLLYISCSMCAKTLLLFCVYEQRLCHVFAVYMIAMHVHQSDKAKNRSIYCITQACKCAKAELCLRSIYVCDVYELQRMRKDVAVVLCI